MSEEELTFTGLLNELMTDHLLASDYWWDKRLNGDGEEADFLMGILDSFDLNGGFLDAIPKEDWADIIKGTDEKKGLIDAIWDYTRKLHDLWLREEYPGVDRPLDKINRHIVIIEKFEELVASAYNRAVEGRYGILWDEEVEAALHVAKILKGDLVEEGFGIFPRTDYYA